MNTSEEPTLKQGDFLFFSGFQWLLYLGRFWISKVNIFILEEENEGEIVTLVNSKIRIIKQYIYFNNNHYLFMLLLTHFKNYGMQI